MASSKSIINAAKDQDLRIRAVALAAELGIDSPEAWIDSQLYQLASASVDATGNTVASVYEYAESEYKKALAAMPKPPGQDETRITDDHLRHALRKMSGMTNPPA